MNKIVDSEDMEILERIDEAKKTLGTASEMVAPAGFIPISLSSEGSFDVPKTVWVKNFSSEDFINLSMASEELLPDYLIPVLNSNIWNPDKSINIANWTEPQIIELLIKLYANFFGKTITGIVFPMEKEDFEFIEKKENAYIKEQMTNGWTPTVDIDLTKLKFYDLKDKKVSKYIRVKKQGINTLFSVPRYGDILLLKKFIEDKYKATDEKYETLKKENVTPEQRVELMNYFTKKSSFISKLTKCYYLQEIDGVSLENTTLKDKVEKYSDDPRLDFTLIKKYEKALNDLKYGVNPEVEVINPFTNNPCTRRFVFRPFNILSIIFLSESDEYDVSYE